LGFHTRLSKENLTSESLACQAKFLPAIHVGACIGTGQRRVACGTGDGKRDRVSSKRLPDGRMVTAPLDAMAPFLPREEFLENMIMPPVREEP